jgi:hypothetical protein
MSGRAYRLLCCFGEIFVRTTSERQALIFPDVGLLRDCCRKIPTLRHLLTQKNRCLAVQPAWPICPLTGAQSASDPCKLYHSYRPNAGFLPGGQELGEVGVSFNYNTGASRSVRARRPPWVAATLICRSIAFRAPSASDRQILIVMRGAGHRSRALFVAPRVETQGSGGAVFPALRLTSDCPSIAVHLTKRST